MHVSRSSRTRSASERWFRDGDRRPPINDKPKVLALPLIAEHKAKLLEARPRLEAIWRHKYEPGREHVGPNGGRIIATDRELIHLDASGLITEREPNGELASAIVGLERRLGLTVPVFVETTEKERPTIAPKIGDDFIFETHLKHANVTGYFEREAGNVWALFKQLTDNQPLTDATRDDGRKLVQRFANEGLKSATIRKKIGWLTAAVNLGIKEGRLKFNPFSGVVPRVDDKQTRLPLSDAYLKECKRNLSQLDDADQLLFQLLAATGMRLSEAFEIDGEMKERGCRYVIVGKKTKESERRLPLPAAVLPVLPKIVRGPLLRGEPPSASKRLNRFLNDCGIADPRKVVHSLRHPAQDRLRAAGCPEDVRRRPTSLIHPYLSFGIIQDWAGRSGLGDDPR